MALFKKPSGILSIALISLFALVNSNVMAQNEVAIGSTTTKSNAILWLNGNGSQGLILPVVTSKSAVSNPDKGMIVYDDSDNKVWYRSNSAWVEVGSGGSGGSNDNLNLSIQGNQLLLRDGTTVLSSIAVASGTQITDAFMVFQNGAWQFASINDISRSGGNLQVTGIRGKSVASLPNTTQALVYDPSANSGNGGWTFQPLSGASGVTSVSGTAPVTVTNPTTTPTISLTNGGITNTLLADNAVNSAKVQDGTLIGADIANGSITADKLGQSGATNNQVLQWNGTTWVPATLASSGTVTQIITGTGLTGGPITTTGTISIAANGVGTTQLADNSVTTAKINTASVDNTKLADNAVNSAKILDGTITGADIATTTITTDKLAASDASNGQVLKWNGTNWVPQADNTGTVLPALATGQLLTNNGTNDVAVTMSGDATFTGTGALTIANNAVTTTKLADNSVTSAKIVNATVTGADIAATTITGANIAATTITADKLAQSGAANNQVLQWNGTNWVPATQNFLGSTLNSTQLFVGNASNVATAVTMSGDATISNTGALTIANNAINSTKISDGSITGTDIAANTITGSNIAGTTITADKLAQSGAANNQVLQWNGTNWVPATQNFLGSTLNSTQLFVGNASNVATAVTMSGDATISNTGALTIANNAINSAKISDGSISGTDIAATTITGSNIAGTTITADKIAASGALNGQVLKWNGTNWVPQDDNGGAALPVLAAGQLVTNDGTTDIAVTMSGDATFTGTGALTIANNAITTTKLADNSVTSAKIVNATVTGADIAATTITGGNIAATTITADKLAQSGATNNQVLQWNGTNWVPATQNFLGSTLNSTQLFVGNASNVATAVTMSGDATLSNTGTLTIANNAINSAKISDGSISGTDIAATTITGSNIAGTTITADKLAQSGAANNQVLQWNGTNWAPATQNFLGTTLNSTQLFVGNASNVATAVTMSGDATLSNTGALTIANNAITTTKIANTAVDATKLADNAVTTAKINAGAVDNTKLADNSVTSVKISDGTISSSDLSTLGAVSPGQILQWNGTSWAAAILPATPIDITTQTGVLVGDGTTITGTTAGAGVRGILGSSNNTIGWVTGTPNQILGTNALGDLQFADQSNFVSSSLNSAQILVGNASNTASAVTMSGDATISNTGTLTIANDAINSAKISDGSITGTDIAATTITADKLSQSGAANNQVLQWNGTNWVPATQNFLGITLNSTQLFVGNASNVATAVTMSGDATISNTGALTIANNAINSAKISDGSITGTDIAATTITGSNIAGTTITADKLAQSGAANNQVLQWNGTNWVPTSLVADFSTLNIIPKGNGSGLVASQIFDNGTNMGIGTVTPAAKLDIIGTIKITDGSQAAGRVLTSDANGLASWQPAGAGSGWTLTGNGGTVDGTNFIGTTNNVPFNIRVNNVTAGRLESTTGSNTFLGFRSGLNNTGSNNTAVGVNSLDGITNPSIIYNSGDFNSAFGNNSLQSNTTGNNNSAFGYNTLQSNTSGIENTALGYQALYTNQSTSLNTAVGKGALYFHGSIDGIGITGNTAVGYEALYRNNPSDGTDGKWNTALGYNAGDQNITGTGNTFIGTNAGDNITTGDDNTFLGFGANATLGTYSNATAIGAGASVNANDKVRIGNTSVGVIEGQVPFSNPSDIRFKKNVREISGGINLIKQLRPVSYQMISGDNRTNWGFIAQEVEEIVGTGNAVLTIGPDSERHLGLRYTDFIAPMVKAIQEQQDQIEALKAQLKDKDDKVLNLESSVNSMKEELETIKRALGMETTAKSSSKNK